MTRDSKLNEISLSDIMFLDIETVPKTEFFNELSDSFQKHWEKKSAYFRNENEKAEDVFQRAGIYAEFGKIICISVGVMVKTDNINQLRVKSFYGDDESLLLSEFSQMLDSWDKKGLKTLCGHNIKEFDIPYISRRLLVNGLKLPYSIDNSGKKPWEVKHLDTLELWKFGDYKNYTSLALLTDLFDIPTPKNDIDGSMVAEVYYKEKNLKRIVEYCEKDVLAVTNLVLRFRNEPIISNDAMIIA